MYCFHAHMVTKGKFFLTPRLNYCRAKKRRLFDEGRSRSCVSQRFPIKDYSPVSSCGASTGFDCGEPFSLKKIDNTTMANTDKNSLCQFWNDSNQKRALVI